MSSLMFERAGWTGKCSVNADIGHYKNINLNVTMCVKTDTGHNKNTHKKCYVKTDTGHYNNTHESFYVKTDTGHFNNTWKVN